MARRGRWRHTIQEGGIEAERVRALYEAGRYEGVGAPTARMEWLIKLMRRGGVLGLHRDGNHWIVFVNVPGVPDMVERVSRSLVVRAAAEGWIEPQTDIVGERLVRYELTERGRTVELGLSARRRARYKQYHFTISLGSGTVGVKRWSALYKLCTDLDCLNFRHEPSLTKLLHKIADGELKVSKR